jgi:hypothetical protein
LEEEDKDDLEGLPPLALALESSSPDEDDLPPLDEKVAKADKLFLTPGPPMGKKPQQSRKSQQLQQQHSPSPLSQQSQNADDEWRPITKK